MTCLRGDAPPEGLARDLRQLLDLKPEAQREFWEVLGAYLRPELGNAEQQAIVSYCSRHELDSDTIAPIVKATRFLFQGVAHSGCSPERFTADLSLLLDEDDARELVVLMLPWLEDMIPKVRHELAEQSVLDHGKLVTSARWRLDSITSSDRVDGLAASVAVVTFEYREGEKRERITLHMLPDQVGALRDATEEMLG